MGVKRKIALDKYLEYSRNGKRVLFDIENCRLQDVYDEYGKIRHIVICTAGDRAIYYQLEIKDFYEYLALYLAGRRELWAMNQLVQQLVTLTNQH
ncbi:hypothetical protein HNQ80_001182 [Anaerosolibacter carboniphilus]|uniref:Uncharacterized protein n=1 Tax=Anaerosolibacter carboniphilus TaxID=1417629 RepID=A0A841KNW3_9FIRM|nr:hypothetical protein [Anaerosolibacter carboniphilus]MBB6215093.1 hypothetical protein [Anaerosolibacter carboniphilus]